MASNVSSAAGPVSVAGSSSAAAAGGSVINVSSLVSQLVAASEAPQQALIASQTRTNTTNISALGSLKSALSTFQSSLTALSTTSHFNAVKASTSDNTVFTASAGSSAIGGSYAIKVTNLASAQQLLSGPFVGGSSAVVGTGTLALTLGGSSFNVTIDSTNNTVAGVASAINSAAANPGISATVITGTDGAHLVLSSNLTGAANTISVTETDGGNALAAVTFGPGNTAHYTQEGNPADATFSIAGVPFTSATNTVTGALTGVTLNLAGQTAPGASATLTVANDTSTIEANIQSFVAAYNTLQGTFAQLGSFDSTTHAAGPMLGNPVLAGIQGEIHRTLHSLVGSSTYNSLASVGITTNKDGSLTLNTATLQTALTSNLGAVSQLFSSSKGVAAQLNTQITSELASGNSIDSYAKTLIAQQSSLTDQTNKLNSQMAALQASLTQQYSALNSLLSSLQTTSAQLSQAFATLPSVQGKANA
jgi:flagellar hook-associated protein 2